MDRCNFYEPPPDYSDSESDELQYKSLGMINVQRPNHGLNHHRALGLSMSVHSSDQASTASSGPDERSNEVCEIVLPPSGRLQTFIPRSNWTLCEKKPKVLHNRLPIGVLNSLKHQQHQQLQQQIQLQQDSHHQVRNRANAVLGHGHQLDNLSGATTPPFPPPPPPLPGALKSTLASVHMFSPSPPTMPKPKPRRTMSVKSAVNPFNQDTMKPLINEFRFYQKTHKNILGQKSELQKVIEKRQQREKIKQLEEEKTTQKSGLEKILELRALKITATNSTTANNGANSGGNNQISCSTTNDNSRAASSVVTLVTSGGANSHNGPNQILVESRNKQAISCGASLPTPVLNSVVPHAISGGSANGNAPKLSNSNQVKLILETIESNSKSQQRSLAPKAHQGADVQGGKFCKRPLDFPSSGNPWSASKAANFVR